MGLVAVSRTIRTEKDDKYTAAMKSLLAGTKEKDQTNVIPKKAKLRSVSVKDGIATADFSKELQQNFSGGSTGEEMLVGSIVNTLTEFPEVQKVRILIDGAPVETLSGHMDLSEPLARMTEPPQQAVRSPTCHFGVFVIRYKDNGGQCVLCMSAYGKYGEGRVSKGKKQEVVSYNEGYGRAW